MESITEIEDSLEIIQGKYFGNYELTDDQYKAISILQKIAELYVDDQLRIKGCPFCGCLPEKYKPIQRLSFGMRCSNQNCQSRRVFMTEKDALIMWNLRA